MERNLFNESEESLKYYKKIGMFKRFKYYFKMIDIYAIPITLRYKNQRKFYTNFGALTTTVILLTMLSLFSSYITQIIK